MLPDLLIVDGGKGQLSRAVKVLEQFGLTGKCRWSVWQSRRRSFSSPAGRIPILLPRHSQGLYLIQRIRDEAHRFAITAHRKHAPKRDWPPAG